ncbi:MAG TPA: N-methyl-L-tryptophan oxidase [Gemmatimonadaceae bacterium]|nr:N-methyl-L-tryptophan oxidase [Gemmatimonadaceae bacterium]
MAKAYDVAVLGVGGMGSAAAFHMARRGLSVIAVEQFESGHDRGSSHGLSRIIRLAYFEHPSYVPLLRRAFTLWRELEEESGEAVLHVTGAIDAGPPGSRVVEGSLESCRVHGLPHDLLDGAELNERFPGFRLPDEYRAVFQPDGGFLEPERCIRAHVRLARGLGATVREGVRVRSWRQEHGGVAVELDDDVIRARQIVVCAGAWMSQLVPSLAPLLRPERQVVGWFETAQHGLFDPVRFPVFVLTTGDGIFYGFPESGVPGFKIGKYHHRAEAVDPDAVRRSVDEKDEAVLRDCIRACFPAANGRLLKASTCIFTNTPDEHFIVDRLPEAPEAIVVSACSGHGFKFCSVIGEIVADLVTEGSTRHDLSLFRLDRFSTLK